MVRRLARRWAVVAIVAPIAAAGARRLSRAIEARRGPSRPARLLWQAADAVARATGRTPARKRRA